MAFSPDKENQHSPWTRNKKALNNVLFAMHLNSKNQTETAPPTAKVLREFTDRTSLLSDEIWLKILAKLPKSQRNSNFLVSRRWLNLQGRLVRSTKLLDWDFLVSGRLFLRFPNLTQVDLVNECLIDSGVFISTKIASLHNDCFVPEIGKLSPNEVDKGLGFLASVYPNLRKLAVANATELGLLSVGEECSKLIELELHLCNDQVLRGIAAFQNLQILRMSGSVSDTGLTILAQGCKQLTKLELSGGCRGGYEGIRAIGQCCQMLQELTLCNHEMESGWLLGLAYCDNLKTLRFNLCKRIDVFQDEEEEDLGCCPAIQSLYLEKCQLRDSRSLRALFLVCRNAREVALHNCWGLSDDMLSTASVLRRVSSLCLQGCPLITADGLERLITPWRELKSLSVKSCSNVKGGNPVVFAALKKLKWEPDTKSRLAANLAGTGIGKRGAKFFNRRLAYTTPLQMLETTIL